jgi:hypothetical protein
MSLAGDVVWGRSRDGRYKNKTHVTHHRLTKNLHSICLDVHTSCISCFAASGFASRMETCCTANCLLQRGMPEANPEFCVCDALTDTNSRDTSDVADTSRRYDISEQLEKRKRYRDEAPPPPPFPPSPHSLQIHSTHQHHSSRDVTVPQTRINYAICPLAFRASRPSSIVPALAAGLLFRCNLKFSDCIQTCAD